MSKQIYYRKNDDLKSPPPPPPPKKKKIKFDFKKMKKNTHKSLCEVECFLNDFHHFFNYVKLYKILK